MKASSISWLAVSYALIACGGGSSPTDSEEPGKKNENPEIKAEALVGTSGGLIASESDEVSLSVPPGALESDVTITVEVEEQTVPEGVALLSPVYRFEPAGLKFSKPAIVELRFEGDAEGVVAFWSREDGIGYETLEGTIQGQSLFAEVHHFSEGFVGRRAEAGCGMYDPMLVSAEVQDAVAAAPLCHPGLCPSGTRFAYCDGPVAVCCGTPDPEDERSDPTGAGGMHGGGDPGSAGAAGSNEGGTGGGTMRPEPEEGTGGGDPGAAGSAGAAGSGDPGAAGSAGAAGSGDPDAGGTGAGGTGAGGSDPEEEEPPREEPPPQGGDGGRGGTGADGAAGSSGVPSGGTGS